MGELRDAVAFAWYMPRIERANSYIEILENHYKDCDIFIGVNPNSDVGCLELLENAKSNLNLKYMIVPPRLEMRTTMADSKPL